VRVLKRGQGRRVLPRLARRRQEHPHQQLIGLDRRVVAVLQQHGPLHDAAAESLSQLTVDGPLDSARLGVVHRGGFLAVRSKSTT
jgi:hypothetical protein